jgi:molybdopterin molybdotransferase
MLSVDEAAARIAATFTPLKVETVPIAKAAARVLAEDAIAAMDQPPAPVSAMDGYAVHSDDVREVPSRLTLIGEAPAGRPFPGRLCHGHAVRIFTGGVVPEGADSVVIQEDTAREGDVVVLRAAPRIGENVRAQGLDFRAGEVVLTKGHRLSARDTALLAAADFADVRVVRKPRVALVMTGDELSRPGEARQAGGIVASSTYALTAMIEAWGGEAFDLGILPDRIEAFAGLPAMTRDFDLIVTQGGASVGDHDLIQRALAPFGFALDFWKIAMRPGKPLIFGHLNGTPLLGLPGNPVSAMVCAILFVRPALAAMLGTPYAPEILHAKLASPLKANGARQDYIRTRISLENGGWIATPFAVQDSSMQRIFAEADGLIVRRIGAPATDAGDEVDVLMLRDC